MEQQPQPELVDIEMTDPDVSPLPAVDANQAAAVIASEVSQS